LKKHRCSIPAAALSVITGIPFQAIDLDGIGAAAGGARSVEQAENGGREIVVSFGGLDRGSLRSRSIPIGKTSRSTPATYIKFSTNPQSLCATTGSRMRGYSASRFSFNAEGGVAKPAADRSDSWK